MIAVSPGVVCSAGFGTGEMRMEWMDTLGRGPVDSLSTS
jgi:hypothetical protein